MSELSATQIPKPADEQAFERANEVLWRAILLDASVKLHGRRGQKQDGVDLYGLRDGASDKIVGVQSKQKSEGKTLEEDEVRDEVRKALGFRPLLSEYYIVTTAPDDANMDRLALALSIEASEGRDIPLKVRIFGWETLEREIRRFPAAMNAFDPSHTPHGDLMVQKVDELPEQVSAALAPKLDRIQDMLAAITGAVDTSAVGARLESQYDGEIDGYIRIGKTDPAAALGLFRSLEGRLDTAATGRTRFRVAANIASCQLDLGDDDAAIAGLTAAYAFDPENPQAAANKALALLLAGDWPQLKAFALEKFVSMPDNAGLACYFLQGAIGKEPAAAVEALLPAGVSGSAEVAVARVRRAMEEGPRSEWWDIAIAAQSAHPTDERLDEFRADALLDRVMAADGFRYGRVLDDAEQADLAVVVDVLKRKWEKLRLTKPADTKKTISTPINLSVAYRLLHRLDDALAVMREAMDWKPNDAGMMERAAAIMMERGDRASAKALLDRIELNADTVQMRFNLAMNEQDWAEVASLVNNHIDLFPAAEQGIARASGITAAVELAPAGDREKLLQAETSTFVEDARANAILAQTARNHGLEDLAENFYLAARKALRKDATFAARMSIADEAMHRAEPGVAADILFGHVDTSRDSQELRMLADALAHDIPVRQRAVDFFENLPPAVRAAPRMLRREAIYLINRGTHAAAVPLLERSFEADRRLSTFVMLMGLYLLLDRRDEIAPRLAEAGLEQLPGNPIDRMKLAQLMHAFGDQARAMEIGYQVLVENTDRAEVVLRYFGLILKPETRTPLEGISTVGAGAWVRFTSEGSTYEAIVAEVADRIWGARADEANAFIRKASGLKAGDTFAFDNGLGQAEIWTVAEVKPRWLHAFHVMSATFRQRFPGATGFYSLTMKEGDIGPTLEQVKRYSEAVRENANAYLEHNLPLGLVANDRTGGAIAFADYLVSIGEEIRTCAGDAAERSAAHQLILDNKGRGAVLDALTAWRAAELDVLDVLQAVLGPLSLPATEMAVLKGIIDDHADDGVGERMTLSYVNGQFVRDVTTAADRAAHRAVLVERVARIENACASEAVIIPDVLPELAEMLLKFPNGQAIAPAILVRQDRLFLSDDLMMRQLTREVFGARGVWLQAVLLAALDRKAISYDRYCDALVLLAAHRHGFVSTNAPVFLSVFRRDADPGKPRFQALLHYLGGETADARTHLDIATQLINALWDTDPTLEAKAATGRILTAMLTRYRPTTWQHWAAYLWDGLERGPRAYLAGWLRGHFLPIAPVKAVLAEARSVRSAEGDRARSKRFDKRR